MNNNPALNQIRNYYQLDATTGTAGQPEADHFPLIRKSGYELVINLALHDSPHALENEAQLAEQQGLEYVHIPVDFRKPEITVLDQFFTVLQKNRQRNVFIHCALNWRVSSFMYLYRVIREGVPEPVARKDLLEVWQPDQTWEAFMKSAFRKYKHQS